uniref:non-specific serine/threonine protein kinase n=1 Tax=Zea mays TaxID=4577 RepID=A0A804RDP9_MAIZE
MVSDGARGLLGAYELGRTLGEGNFGKVKQARHRGSGGQFAVKIMERARVLSQRADEQICREIATLKLLAHPNVVRLHEVAASKTKIYMVLELVNGGELLDRIAASEGKLPEQEARRLFQQLVDGVSYCHEKGVCHRDLKLENVLVDRKGNIKISDFGLSALPQHLGNDGLLHTTCGSPNYIAPEVLQNRGYDGSLSDIWSCGVILYVMLVGHLPFDDRNIVVLYQKIPEWLSPGARNLLRRILEPDPAERIAMAEIKAHPWFQEHYVPVLPPYDDDDDHDSVKQIGAGSKTTHHINAFQLIGMASSLDLSGFFEEEDVSQRKIRFTSAQPPEDLFAEIERSATDMGFHVHRGHSKADAKLRPVEESEEPYVVVVVVVSSLHRGKTQQLNCMHPQVFELTMECCAICDPRFLSLAPLCMSWSSTSPMATLHCTGSSVRGSAVT